MLRFERPRSATLHELRKRTKDHAHQLALLRSTWQGPMQARRSDVERLADLLGDDHDLTTLRATLLECADEPDTPAVLETTIGLIERRQVELRTEAERIAALIYAERPKAFARRLERYWRIWRRKAAGSPVRYRPRLVTV